MSRVLAIADLHEPVCRKHYLQFCKDLYEEWSCNKVIFIGDVVDWSAISFHQNNPEAPGPKDEYGLAKKSIQKWYKAFPKATILVGNHDCRPQRLAESVNIPAGFIKEYPDLWGTPNWKWEFSTVIDNVFYCHGHGKGGGLTPAFNLAKCMGMSVVMGHFHSVAGIMYQASTVSRVFGMNLGWGGDDAAYAFAYAKEQAKRGLLGAGIILEGKQAFYEIMPISKGERYYDQRQVKRQKS